LSTFKACCSLSYYWCDNFAQKYLSVAESHHFDAAPAPEKIFDAPPAPAGLAPTLLNIKLVFLKSKQTLT
jgi:hypothetical protein